MGYTVEQSQRLLTLTEESNPGPYYYLACLPIADDGSPPDHAGSFLDNLKYDKNAKPCANLAVLCRVFRRDTEPTKRWGIFVSAGHPADIQSPVIMLDTAWLERAVKSIER